jgi:microcystin-dependent protein
MYIQNSINGQVVNQNDLNNSFDELLQRYDFVSDIVPCVYYGCNISSISGLSIHLTSGQGRQSDVSISFISSGAEAATLVIPPNTSGHIVVNSNINSIAAGAYSYHTTDTLQFVTSLTSTFPTGTLVGQTLIGNVSSTSSGVTVNYTNVKRFDFDLLTKPLFSAGDEKASLQTSNHSGVGGMWLLEDGSTYSYNTYPLLGALLGGVPNGTFKVPDERNRVTAGSSSTHLTGSTTGAETQIATVLQHSHPLSAYKNHTHGLTEYNNHTHNDNHSHVDDHYHTDLGHSHAISSATEFGVGGRSISGAGEVGAMATEIGHSSIAYKSKTGVQTASTSLKSNSGFEATTGSATSIDPTDFVLQPGLSTDTSGTAEAKQDVMQPTSYKNKFIFAI